ncbi:MAG TPA: AI-2E family transporter [Bacteroidetes bacterium]|nr:AI-2E family transporter [Bacteroidota bacterium]
MTPKPAANKPLVFPAYAKATLMLVGIFVLFSILFIAESIILPILYAFIIAIVVEPVVRFLVKRGFNRALASLIVLILIISLLAVMVMLVASQANKLGEAWPQINVKIQEMLKIFSDFIADQFNLSNKEIDTYVNQMQDEMMSNGGSKIGITLSALGGIFATVMLTPVYTFMLLYYQPHLIDFIHKLFTKAYDKQVTDVLSNTKSLVQSYLLGLSIEFVILAVLNSLGLLLVGLDYAILLGIIGALLNIIPYLGGIIAVVLYMLVALVTKEPVHVLYVLGIYSFIQFFDNNFIVPKIVGSKVKLNALVSIVVVIAGAALWGIPGMFLAIPVLGIVKLILDVFPAQAHWGNFLGEPVAPTSKLVLKLKKIVKA